MCINMYFFLNALIPPYSPVAARVRFFGRKSGGQRGCSTASLLTEVIKCPVSPVSLIKINTVLKVFNQRPCKYYNTIIYLMPHRLFYFLPIRNRNVQLRPNAIIILFLRRWKVTTCATVPTQSLAVCQRSCTIILIIIQVVG